MLDLILALGNKALMPKHWKEIFLLVEKDDNPQGNYTLKEFKDWGMQEFKEQIEEISGIATGEYQIMKQLQEIESAWDKTSFIVLAYRDNGKDFILGTSEEMTAQLEDHQVAINTMLGSKFANEIRDSVEKWGQRLSLYTDIIDEWFSCQKQWMYLENIFSADDITK